MIARKSPHAPSTGRKIDGAWGQNEAQHFTTPSQAKTNGRLKLETFSITLTYIKIKIRKCIFPIVKRQKHYIPIYCGAGAGHQFKRRPR